MSESSGNSAYKNPKHYAIVVGIDDYDDFNRSNIESLSGCVNDAVMFKRWLIDYGGLDPLNIKMFLSTTPRPNPIRPIKDEIESHIIGRIREFQTNGKLLGDRLYLWFSGHGIIPTRDENECAILMANAQLLALGRSFPGRFAARDLCYRNMYREVVLFMDCCRTISGLETATIGYNAAGNPGPNGVKYLQGFSTSSTSTAAERNLPDPLDPLGAQTVHGVFTHALLEGLQMGTNATGNVDSATLANFVKERTQELLPADDNQRPEFRFDNGDLIDFGPGRRVPVHVKLTDPAAGFQVRSGKEIDVVVHRAPTVSGTIATLELAPGRYLFAAPGIGDSFPRWKLVDVVGGPAHVDL